MRSPLLTTPVLIALALSAAAAAKPRDPLAGLHPSGKPVDCLQTRFYDSTAYIGTTAAGHMSTT